MRATSISTTSSIQRCRVNEPALQIRLYNLAGIRESELWCDGTIQEARHAALLPSLNSPLLTALTHLSTHCAPHQRLSLLQAGWLYRTLHKQVQGVGRLSGGE